MTPDSMRNRGVIKAVFSVFSIQEAIRIGNARCGAKSDGTREHDSGYHEDNNRAVPHWYGVLGEIFAGEIGEVSIDESIHESGDNDDMNGVEVKTSTWDGPDVQLKIKCTEYDRKRPRAYILVHVSKDIFNRSADPREDQKRRTAYIIGYITRDDFDAHKRKRTYGHKDNWTVSEDDLVDATQANIRSLIRNIEITR